MTFDPGCTMCYTAQNITDTDTMYHAYFEQYIELQNKDI